MYKRQVHICLNALAMSVSSLYPKSTLNEYKSSLKEHYVVEFELPFLKKYMAVSYTHLDVYKRQIWNRLSALATKGSARPLWAAARCVIFLCVL